MPKMTIENIYGHLSMMFRLVIKVSDGRQQTQEG